MRLTCIVCHEIFSPSENVHAAPCGHILHYDCWIEWLERHKNCPECRKPTQSAELLRLFFTFDSEEGDYSTLSTKYNTLKYEFHRQNKEAQTTNATLEKQKTEIESLRLQVQQWKSKVSELQRAKTGIEDVIQAPAAPAPAPAPWYPLSTFVPTYNPVLPPTYHSWYAPPVPAPSLADPWGRTHDGSSGEVTFQHKVTNVSSLQDLQTSSSPNFLIRNLPWKIRIIPRTKTDPTTPSRNNNENRYLGFFLQCNGEDISTTWSCYATADLRILPQKEGVPVFERKINHLYHHTENDWGFRHFVQMSTILNPAKGYLKDDTVIVEVRVQADTPVGISRPFRPGSSVCTMTHLTNDYRKRLRQY